MKDKKREKMIMYHPPTQAKIDRQGNSDCERTEVEERKYILGRGTKKNED